MVSIGFKGLPLRTPKSPHLTEDYLMAGEDNSHNQGGRKRSIGGKGTKKRAGFGGNCSSKNLFGGVPDETFKAQKFSSHQKDSEPQTSFVRKQVYKSGSFGRSLDIAKFSNYHELGLLFLLLFSATAVMVTALEGHVEALCLLVYAGADVKLSNKYGETTIRLSKLSPNCDLFEKVMLEFALKKGNHNGGEFHANDMSKSFSALQRSSSASNSNELKDELRPDCIFPVLDHGLEHGYL